MPWWLSGFLFDGVYLATAWVVSVMLPPMAIFFPIFTLLEDFGYLPRVAFNLDRMFQKVGAHGKQALTMCMGFGCNAAGVVATRVIDSPRERLVAIITNNFSLCNGRWPTQILIATIFLGGAVPAPGRIRSRRGRVVGIAVLASVSCSRPRGCSPARCSRARRRLQPRAAALPAAADSPDALHLAGRSHLDRALARGGVRRAGRRDHLAHLQHSLRRDQPGRADRHVAQALRLLVGLNGVILLAYVVAIPANEIVIPTVLMLTVLATRRRRGRRHRRDVRAGFDHRHGRVLRAAGWTTLTGINLMLFSLLHNPCSTTIYTIYKETRSAKWTTVSTLLPVVMGFLLCFVVAQTWHLVTGA